MTENETHHFCKCLAFCVSCFVQCWNWICNRHIYDNAVGVDPYEIGRVYGKKKYADVVLIGSFVVSVVETIIGILPGIGKSLKIKTVPRKRQSAHLA